jgi:hypothetical protein
MNRAILLILVLVTAAFPSPASAREPLVRRYFLNWTVEVSGVPRGAREAKVWVAVPQELPEQSASVIEVKGDRKWKMVQDPDFKNQVAEVIVSKPDTSFTIDLSAVVLRRAVTKPQPATLDQKARALYLRPESKVALGPRVKAVADSLPDSSRVRYDYVLGHMDYDRSVPGWGHGDSDRALEVGKGNCTDFHSLFVALSRARGVPAFFEMGYPMNPGGETNHVGGYRSWAWFHDENAGVWVPVDIFEAELHPDRADFFFGNLDADRVTFSRGRDIRLPGMKGEPLNFLPAGAYVEVDGKPFEGQVIRKISYRPDGR